LTFSLTLALARLPPLTLSLATFLSLLALHADHSGGGTDRHLPGRRSLVRAEQGRHEQGSGDHGRERRRGDSDGIHRPSFAGDPEAKLRAR